MTHVQVTGADQKMLTEFRKAKKNNNNGLNCICLKKET